MPDLAQGYTADIVLAADESVRVSTTGQATVTSAYGAPAGTTTLTANTSIFGPYQVPAKLIVTAVSGKANYAQPEFLFTPVKQDPVTGALVGVGSKILRPWETSPPRHTELRSGRSLVGWSLANNSSATGSMAIVDNSPFGGPAIRVTIPDDVGSVDVIADDLGLSNFTAGRGNLVWHVHVEDELAIKQWQVHAGNDTSLTRNITNTYNLSNNNLNRANGHHIGSLNPDNATANTLLTTDTVNRFRLRFFGQPAGGGATRYVWIGGVYVPESVQPWMVVTVDDSDISMFTRFHPELAARSLRATFAIDWDNVGTNPSLFVSQAQLQAMHDYGHDIASHNRTNTAYAAQSPPTAQPNDAARLTYCTEYRYTRNLMRQLGWNRCLGYHPFVQGGHDGALVQAMKAHGASVMRTTGPGHIEPFRADLQSVFRQRQLGNAFTLANAKSWVDSAVTRNQDFMVMGHILGPTANSSVTWAQTDFAELLDYALAAGVRVGSVSEWGNARGVAV